MIGVICWFVWSLVQPEQCACGRVRDVHVCGLIGCVCWTNVFNSSLVSNGVFYQRLRRCHGCLCVGSSLAEHRCIYVYLNCLASAVYRCYVG